MDFWALVPLFAADLNLVLQLVMGAALGVGVLFAKYRRYRAHGICQATVLLVNLLMIVLVMWPSFHEQPGLRFAKVFHRRYYTVAAVHAALGMGAEALEL